MTAILQANSKSFPWWAVLIQGICMALIGVLLLFSPGETTLILIQLLGIYWLVSGIFSIVAIFIDHSLWGWKLFSGILGILAGFVIIQHPLWSAVLVPTTLIILIGIEGIVIGIINIIQAFQGAGWGIGILGVFSIIFGLILLGSPLVAATILPFVLGGFAVVGGIAGVFMAFKLRKA